MNRVRSEEHRKRLSIARLVAMQNGFRPNTSGLIKGAHPTNQTVEALSKRANKAAQKMRGRIILSGPNGRHAGNHGAKEWRFVCKRNGHRLIGKNLNQLIRDNELMFEEKDAVYRKGGSNAARCLRSIATCSAGSGVFSWKGWVVAYD